MSGHTNLKDTVLEISGVNPRKCMQCGKCSGTCPAYGEMEYHPHQFVTMVDRGQIEKLMASPSLYRCLACLACLERCRAALNRPNWSRPCACSSSASRDKTT